jgi:hypothetical protein
MRAYSVDLRRKRVQTIDKGMTKSRSAQRVPQDGYGGAKSCFWVKTPRPIEEPGTLTRRSKDPRSLRLGVVVSMAQTLSGTSAK